jgi:alkylation response protein AidB-like acyl-CoA dehydrogenase
MTMIDIAAQLRDGFAERAGELDRSGRFPSENYDDMRRLGYLRGPVPTPLGGLGADLVETVAAQRALAWACASTALAVNMHLFQVGAAADGWRSTGANEGPLRKVADAGIVLGSTGAEAVVAGEWSTATTAVRSGDEYVLNGRKYFCSQAPAMDMVRVNATDTETGEILVVAVPAATEGVQIVETWDTLGMRATASHDVVLTDVRVPASAVGVRLSPDAPAWDPRFANVIKWFVTLTTSVYVGIADRARAEALDSIGIGSNSSHRAGPLTDAMVGALESAHFQASSALEWGSRTVAGLADPVEAMVAAITMKDVATRAASEVVDRAVALVGGRAYFKTSVLERLTRDVRAAGFHPPAAPVSHQMIGIHLRAGEVAATLAAAS